MAFMVPEYVQEDFVEVTTDTEWEGFWIPADVFDANEHVLEDTVRGKWWARLTAPGFMDSTGWGGPFDTLKEAKAAIRDAYGVDPDTGEDLEAQEFADLDFGGVKKKRKKKRSMQRRTQPKRNPAEYELPRLTIKEARDLVRAINERLKAGGSQVRVKIKREERQTRKGRKRVSHQIIMSAPGHKHGIGVQTSSKLRLFAHLHGFCGSIRMPDGSLDPCTKILDEVYAWHPQTFKGPVAPKPRRSMQRKKQPNPCAPCVLGLFNPADATKYKRGDWVGQRIGHASGLVLGTSSRRGYWVYWAHIDDVGDGWMDYDLVPAGGDPNIRATILKAWPRGKLGGTGRQGTRRSMQRKKQPKKNPRATIAKYLRNL